MASQFIQDRITAAKALLVAYEDAILAVTTGGVQSYTLNTGQTIQTVTKLDVDKMNAAIDSILNRIITLEARCTNGGVSIGRPL